MSLLFLFYVMIYKKEVLYMKKARLFWSIVRRCNGEKITIGFILSIFMVAFIIMIKEPGVSSYGDALWYTFVSSSTIGFGDIVVTTTISKLLTVYITLYQALMIAMLSGVIVSHYLEVIQRREEYTITVFMDKLEHLSELNDEEIKQIQEKIKKLKMTM
nr:potassium channel family protein [Anaerofustis stercorihominis]